MANFGQTDIDQQNTIFGVNFLGAPFTFIAHYSNSSHNDTPNKGITISFGSITDGLSNTLLMSETIVGKGSNDLRGLTWWTDATSFTTYLGPNSQLPDVMYSTAACPPQPPTVKPPCRVAAQFLTDPLLEGARSYHEGGVNATMGDGSVRFFKNTISLPIWRAVSSTRGGEVISADQY